MLKTVKIKPFKAFHYNPEKINNIGDCLSQPYDVITPEQQDRYYKQHKYNIIRCILNKAIPEDNNETNRYTRAYNFYTEWKRKKILIQSPEPAFWIYQREYSIGGQGLVKSKGFIGAVRLSDFNKGPVIPHEKVMKVYIDDRMRLTKATKSQFEYIWCYYQDKTKGINDILNECTGKPPLVDYYELPFQVKHRLWKLHEPAACKAISEGMKHLKIFIADGHHRYVSMLNLSKEMRKNNNNFSQQGKPWDYITMYLVNSLHEELTILPYHRMLSSIKEKNWETLKDKLAQFFNIKGFSFKGKDEQPVRKEWLQAISKTKDSANYINSFGLLVKEKSSYFLLRLREIEAYKQLAGGCCSEEAIMLDVNILNILILKRILGFTDEQIEAKKNIDYTHETDEAIQKIHKREADLAFILNPTPLESVTNISLKGEVIPQKSTFFYPKLISGLVIYPMDGDPF